MHRPRVSTRTAKTYYKTMLFFYTPFFNVITWDVGLRLCMVSLDHCFSMVLILCNPLCHLENTVHLSKSSDWRSWSLINKVMLLFTVFSYWSSSKVQRSVKHLYPSIMHAPSNTPATFLIEQNNVRHLDGLLPMYRRPDHMKFVHNEEQKRTRKILKWKTKVLIRGQLEPLVYLK